MLVCYRRLAVLQAYSDPLPRIECDRANLGQMQIGLDENCRLALVDGPIWACDRLYSDG